jgi:hypothetical protein
MEPALIVDRLLKRPGLGLGQVDRDRFPFPFVGPLIIGSVGFRSSLVFRILRNPVGKFGTVPNFTP